MSDLATRSKVLPQRWLLLLHQLPAKPAYRRVKLWRRLQNLGAVAVKNAVYALPASEQSQEDFEWLLKEVQEAGGEAMLCEARLMDGLSDDEVRGLFNSARETDYGEIAAEARVHAAKIEQASIAAEERAEISARLLRLKARLEEISAIDFFGANGREAADGLLAGLEKTLAAEPTEGSGPETVPEPAGLADLKGRVWVTRQGVYVDRIACAWLIRRFIDESAKIKFVPPRGYVPEPGELRFDMFAAEITHEGDRCSFEVLLERSGLKDVGLQAIAEIVHDIDLKDGKFGREETAGLRTLVAGIAVSTQDDEQRIVRGSALLDDFYAYFRKKRG
jgi:hypothetical protein